MIVQKKILGILGIMLLIVLLLWFALSYSVIPGDFFSMTLMIVMSLSLLGVIVVVVVDRIFVSRLAQLSSQIADVRQRRDFAMRVGTGGYDQLSAIVDEINALLTDVEDANRHLRKLNEELEYRVDACTLELNNTNRSLEESLEVLEEAQKQIIESEKMAALGELAAGVTHEVSTPLGIGVTAASLLEDETRKITGRYQAGEMTRSELEVYFKTANESAQMILHNLKRADDHIRRFKQVAVDQTHDTRRRFHMKACLDNVLLSLRPKLKHTPYTVTVRCPDELELESSPGAFSQILTNLIMNSLLHGFETRESGQMLIEVCQHGNNVQMTYQDDGKGMGEEERSHIFEPFFTTKRQQGGTGLGLHIVYDLVTQTLGGQIECTSIPGSGTTFIMTIPVTEQGEETYE